MFTRVHNTCVIPKYMIQFLADRGCESLFSLNVKVAACLDEERLPK